MFAIIANLEIKKNQKYIKEITDYLKTKNVSCSLAKVKQDEFGNYIYELDKKPEYIIALGGDGTILQASQNAMDFNIPIIGFNTGTLGFLSEYQMKNYKDVLEQVLNKRYDIEERMVLEVYKDYELIDRCLNDIVVSREGFSRIVSIEVRDSFTSINKLSGDGVIVSTPTGSTGYNLSLGGPIVSPKAKNIIITPIACHSLLSRPIILDKDEIVHLKILKSRKSQEKEAILTCDGRKNIDLKTNDELTIKTSNFKVKFLKLKPNNFFDICKTKLR